MPDLGDANEMSERARDLLTRANRDGDLDPRVIARVRGAVLAEVGAAAAGGVTVGAAARAIAAKTSVAPLAPAALASSGVAGAGLAVKAAALALIIGVAAAGGYGAGRRSARVAATPVATTTLATAIPSAITSASASAPTVTEPAALPVPTLAPIAPPALPPAASPSMPKVAPPVTPPITPGFGAPASTPWARDMVNLHDAQAALVAGDPRGALKLASLVDPQGPFAGERDAMSLVARCSMDPTDAKAITEARTFETAHAGTPLAERVRAACSSGS